MLKISRVKNLPQSWHCFFKKIYIYEIKSNPPASHTSFFFPLIPFPKVTAINILVFIYPFRFMYIVMFLQAHACIFKTKNEIILVTFLFLA